MKSSVFKLKCHSCQKVSIRKMPFMIVGLHKSKCDICNERNVIEPFFQGEDKSDSLYRLVNALFPLFSANQLVNYIILTNIYIGFLLHYLNYKMQFYVEVSMNSKL